MWNCLSTKYLELSDPHFHEPNQKSFKLLYFAFTRNLETFYKTNKKILTELDEPIIVRLKKQEQSFVDHNLKKIYEENVHKLIKQNLQRNSNIESIMNAHHFQYYQQKSHESKTLQIDKQSIESVEKPERRLVFTDQKSRSKTLANPATPQQRTKLKGMHWRKQESRENISDLDVVMAFSERSEKKIIFFKRDYSYLKNRKKNYSFHSETTQNRNQRLENESTFTYEEQKTSREHNQTSAKENAERKCFNETFRPFCGLNTKDIFVKKPIHKISNLQQNCPISDLKINFASRALIRSRFPAKKTNNHEFTSTIREHATLHPLKDETQTKLMIRNNILKISSDLAIKTIQPQGYRGKSRMRYQSLNEAK